MVQLGIHGGARGSLGGGYFLGGRSGVPCSFYPVGLGGLLARPPLGETLVSHGHRRRSRCYAAAGLLVSQTYPHSSSPTPQQGEQNIFYL